MPLYEYQCESCAHRFETIQKFSDPPLEKCPKCEGPVRKLVAAPAVHFKGSGWYITDYAKKDSGGASKETGTSDQKADAKTAAKTDTSEKTDSKPAATETKAASKD